MRRYLSRNLLPDDIGERRKTPWGRVSESFFFFCRHVEVSRVNRKIPMRSNAKRLFLFPFFGKVGVEVS